MYLPKWLGGVGRALFVLPAGILIYTVMVFGLNKKPRSTLPRRVVFIRHGQSQGNATTETKQAYRDMPDHVIELTEQGHAEAREAGATLRALMAADHTRGKAKFFCSPHARTKQTLESLAIPDDLVTGDVTFDDLLRELDRGFFQQTFETVQRYAAQREKHGTAHYRYPGADSLLDVNQRMSCFLNGLVAFMAAGRLSADDSIVIVSHCAALLQLMGRLVGFGAPTAAHKNLSNCCVLVFERFELDGLERSDGTKCVTTYYAPTPATHRLLGTTALLGPRWGASMSSTSDAEVNAQFADEARLAARTLATALHPGLCFTAG